MRISKKRSPKIRSWRLKDFVGSIQPLENFNPIRTRTFGTRFVVLGASNNDNNLTEILFHVFKKKKKRKIEFLKKRKRESKLASSGYNVNRSGVYATPWGIFLISVVSAPKDFWIELLMCAPVKHGGRLRVERTRCKHTRISYWLLTRSNLLQTCRIMTGQIFCVIQLTWWLIYYLWDVIGRFCQTNLGRPT